MQKMILWSILILAFLLRVYQITDYPAGFSPDEAGQGYTAYSLLKTGKDEWGQAFPLAPRSYGDYRAPLYTYLTVPSVAIFGLNEFSVRFPAVIFGSLAVLVVYLVTIELFAKQNVFDSKKLALLSAFLLAISPWHISLSRGAFEPNLPTLLLPLGIWAFLRGLEAKKYMLFSGLLFGLSLFSYYSARVIAPVLLFFLVIWKIPRDQWIGFVKKYTLAVAVFVLFLFTALSTSFLGGNTRVADVAIFSPTGGWGAVADRRYEAVLQGLQDELARLFSNKVSYTLGQFINNYLSYLSPQFLFTNGAGESTYGLSPGIGLLYLIELPMFIAGLIIFTKPGTGFAGKLIIFWLLISFIPAALAKGPGYAANRAALAMPAIQIISAVGTLACLSLISKYRNIKAQKLLNCFVVALLVSLVFFLESYFYHAPVQNSRFMSYGWRQAVEYLKSTEGEYSQIVVSKRFSEPQIYVAFYNQLDPKVVQDASRDWLRYEAEGKLFVDQLGEYKLGKYVFKTFDYKLESSLDSVLFVGQPQDFPQNIVAQKTVYYPGGKPAVLIVDPSKATYAQTL